MLETMSEVRTLGPRLGAVVLPPELEFCAKADPARKLNTAIDQCIVFEVVVKDRLEADDLQNGGSTSLM